MAGASPGASLAETSVARASSWSAFAGGLEGDPLWQCERSVTDAAAIDEEPTSSPGFVGPRPPTGRSLAVLRCLGQPPLGAEWREGETSTCSEPTPVSEEDQKMRQAYLGDAAAIWWGPGLAEILSAEQTADWHPGVDDSLWRSMVSRFSPRVPR